MSRFLWLLILLAATLYASTHFTTESSLTKLLPKYQNETVNDIVTQASAKVNNQLILMASGGDKDVLIKQFSQTIDTFKKHQFHQQINWQVADTFAQSLYQNLQKMAPNLMPVADQLMQSSPQAIDYFIQQAQEQVYGFQNFSKQQLLADPLLTTPRIIQSLANFSRLRIDLESGYYLTEDSGKYHLAAFISLKDDASKPDFQQHVDETLTTLKNKLQKKHISLYAFGAVRYAYQAYQQAKFEISTVGLGSVLGICLLFIWVFRSLSPLLLSLINITFGLTLGFAVTRFYFGEVHVFAMMFGSTIAGLSVDYCFHYFVESGVYGKKTIHHIFPALLTGFLSSALVYSAFMLTGYEVLAQIALFSIFGLLTVLINVSLWYPKLYQGAALTRLHQSKVIYLIYHNPLQRLLKPTVVIILTLLLMALAYFFIKPNDDIRALQSLSPQLLKEEQVIRNTLNLKTPSQYILVTAKTKNKALEKEAKIVPKLRQKDSQIVGVSDYVPPLKQQKAHYDFYQKIKKSPQFKAYINTLGLPSETLNVAEFKPLPEGNLTNGPLAKMLSSRWIGQVDGLYALFIPYSKVMDFKATQPGVMMVNQVADISGLLSQFRIESTRVLLGSIVILIMALGLLKYALVRSIHMVCLPLLAGLVAYHLAALLGFHISLFSVLSLLLILGIGLDYVIFLSEHKDKRRVMLALMLSASTTVLAFGLLALSQVAVIESFGFMLSVGILCLLLFAPAVKTWDRVQHNEKDEN